MTTAPKTKPNRLTSYERETIIIYNGETMAEIFTWDHKLQADLKSRPEIKVLDEGIHQHPNDHYGRFEVPKSWIKVRPPSRRSLSPEQRQAIGERLHAKRSRQAAVEPTLAPSEPL